MRRTVAVFLDFSRRTGHVYPRRQTFLGNYLELLKAMGRTEAEIHAALDALLGGED